MRNEYATVPYLASVADLIPRVLFADWSQEVIGRDWMVQSHLDGAPAPDRLGDYPRTLWPGFFAQLGTIAKDVHTVRGPHFGSVAGPGYPTWSEAVLASLHAIAVDVSRVGLDAADVRKAADLAAAHRILLDEITEPRLLASRLSEPGLSSPAGIGTTLYRASGSNAGCLEVRRARVEAWLSGI
ncbi:phosphotransferase family protein [Streptomyces sp. NPDC058476]|uniref:phosphotransferase family protein n=1 Tax=unclassified Streptomyces TaxID=2593676 RepID=UPI00365481A0